MQEKNETKGKLSMAYVSMMKGNIPFVLLSFIIPNWDLEKSSQITIDNESVDDTIKRDRLYLEQGLDNAIISAYKMANKEVKINKVHQMIIYITSDAKTDLEVGDINLKVNNNEFEELSALQGYINSLKKDELVSFEVQRGEEIINCTAKVYEIDNSLKV